MSFINNMRCTEISSIIRWQLQNRSQGEQHDCWMEHTPTPIGYALSPAMNKISPFHRLTVHNGIFFGLLKQSATVWKCQWMQSLPHTREFNNSLLSSSVIKVWPFMTDAILPDSFVTQNKRLFSKSLTNMTCLKVLYTHTHELGGGCWVGMNGTNLRNYILCWTAYTFCSFAKKFSVSP